MSQMDLVAVCQSFDALDEGKTGFIDAKQFHLLWLGLGYGRINEQELAAKVQDQHRISLQEVKSVLSKVRSDASGST